MGDYIDEVFGPAGLLAARFPSYAPRAGQVALARAVDAAMRGNENLLAEAPTGTGKSLAYSVPATHYAAEAFVRAKQANSEEEAEMIRALGRVVIVTANISLQEQLVNKDLPLLAEILPWPFRFALRKGRSNYLCLEKLNKGAKEKIVDFDVPAIRLVAKWAEETPTGDKSELSFEPSERVWRRFSVSSDDCAGDACDFFKSCHAESAKKKAARAEVVVTNYHTFMIDLQVRRASDGMAAVLPRYGRVVFDEGHKAAEIAREYFGFKMGVGTFRWIGGMLPSQAPEEIEAKATLEREAERFFDGLLAHRRSREYKARIRAAPAVPYQALLDALDKARLIYGFEIGALERKKELERISSEEKKRLRKLKKRHKKTLEAKEAVRLAMTLSSEPPSPWRRHPELAFGDTPETRWYWDGGTLVKSEAQLSELRDVYFIEDDDGAARLCSKPVFVNERLRAELFDRALSTTVTSATLMTASSFDFVAAEIGADQTKKRMRVLEAASPFAWKEQALLVLPGGVPINPNDPGYPQAAAERCAEVVALARGRTLALFTSRKNMHVARERLQGCGYRVLVQGDMPRTLLISEFKNDVASVLLGLDSFWEGVDVPGESLSCVFIDKIPFLTPEDPIMSALEERDRYSFMKYNVPRGIIRIKQGFGRLIRAVSDRGVVVLLDPRLLHKPYGAKFLWSLPQTQKSNNIEDVRNFLDGAPLGTAVEGFKRREFGPRSLFDQ